MAERIRILLIDDHSLFRESLARLLETEPGFEVAGGYATVAAGLTMMATEAIDVVLLDYDLGDEVGNSLLAQVDVRSGNAKVIMVTGGMTAGATLNAANAGVSGIVLKHSDPRHLIDAIRKVASGGTWWDPAFLRAATASSGDTESSTNKVRSLTQRQRQVLRSILDGFTNKEIASQLQSSETSVKATIQELFSKAGVRTRSQLVRVAIERYSREWLREIDPKLSD